MILTPEQMKLEIVLAADALSLLDRERSDNFYETWTAYAEVVQAVAEKCPYEDEFFTCIWCGVDLDSRWHEGVDITVHSPDCLYLRARKLRGL